MFNDRYHIVTLLTGFFLSIGVLHAQPDSSFYHRNASDKIHQEGKQKKRMEWFSNVKKDSTIGNTEMHRWNEFTRMQERALNRQSATPAADWKCNGPTNQGGRMISYAINPLNYNEVWAGAATGGLWKSTNNGENWQAMTDNIPSCAIGAIAIHPQNPNIMLVGTGEGYLLATGFKYGIGVLKSIDAGLTWTLTNLNLPDSLQFACLNMEWDPVQTNRVYLATTYGVFVSTDAGDNWAMTLSGTASSLVINPQDPSKIYVALQDYGSSNGGIYRSSNSGNTWQLLTTGLPASSLIGFTCLTLCDSFPDVIYAGVSYPAAHANIGKLQGLYKTTDGGNTWTLMPFQYDFYCYAVPNDNICQGWYANVIKVSHTDPNIVYAAGIYTYRSTNGGNTWQYWDYSPQENPPYT
ncbi:MAG: WD40/YVTN/BNR-like repeat-containing protein, partial [Flavobacteriales bacterium]